MVNESFKILGPLAGFSPISLEEMDNVRLMNRSDTKFIFPAVQLPELLEKASSPYRILTIENKNVFRYNSLYYDTRELKSYLDHHNGLRPRYKVRFREYEDTGSVFLEVKRKVANERTRKSRIPVKKIEHVLSEKSMAYINENSPFVAAELNPALWTRFRRITLVGSGPPERITIDTDITFRKENEEKLIPFLAIAEVKRDSSGGSTEFMRILKSARIYPGSSSKYCLGTVLMKTPVKYNRFKRNIIMLNNLENVYRSYSAAGQPG